MYSLMAKNSVIFQMLLFNSLFPSRSPMAATVGDNAEEPDIDADIDTGAFIEIGTEPDLDDELFTVDELERLGS